jgi:hypothetical protein
VCGGVSSALHAGKDFRCSVHWFQAITALTSLSAALVVSAVPARNPQQAEEAVMKDNTRLEQPDAETGEPSSPLPRPQPIESPGLVDEVQLSGTRDLPGPFGHYALLERLGMTGSGEVWKAVALGEADRGRILVIERGSQTLTSSASLADAFLLTAREYLDARTLLSLLGQLAASKRPLPVELAVFVAAQVARGLAHLHPGRLPHGPLLAPAHLHVTPSDVLLLRSGAVKLMDPGFPPRGLLAMTELTEKGIYPANLAYLAPECLQGQVDHRGDIFSLGAVLWESLIGRSLFQGNTRADTLTNLYERVVPPPSRFRAEVPAALDEVVLHALERDPERRYSDVTSMAQELESLLEDPSSCALAMARLLEEIASGTPAPRAAFPAPVPRLVPRAPRAPAGRPLISAPPAHSLALRPQLTLVVNRRTALAVAACASFAVGLSGFLVVKGAVRAIAARRLPSFDDRPARTAEMVTLSPREVQSPQPVIPERVAAPRAQAATAIVTSIPAAALRARPAARSNGRAPKAPRAGRIDSTIDPFEEAEAPVPGRPW